MLMDTKIGYIKHHLKKNVLLLLPKHFYKVLQQISKPLPKAV